MKCVLLSLALFVSARLFTSSSVGQLGVQFWLNVYIFIHTKSAAESSKDTIRMATTYETPIAKAWATTFLLQKRNIFFLRN